MRTTLLTSAFFTFGNALTLTAASSVRSRYSIITLARRSSCWVHFLAQFMGGHEGESVETCKKLLAFDPDFPSARLLMAFALYISGRNAEAEELRWKKG